MKRRTVTILMASTVLVAASASYSVLEPSRGAATPPVTRVVPAAGISPMDTAFLVMMENTDWSSVKGSSSWPYVNSLLPLSAHTENYRSGLHPSLPNYVELESGQTFGETSGSYLPQDHPIASTAHLVTQLTAANLDWKYWAEDLPGNGTTCNVTDPGAPYSLDHNAQVYFDDVRNDAAYCIAHERPYPELSPALDAGTVSGYNLIVPNDYHQGEKLAPGSTNKYRQADDWLRTEIPMIQASAAYRNGAPILILWDESSGTTTNPHGLLVLGKYAKVGYSNTVPYSHGSTLRTMQEIFGVGPFLGDAATATDLGDLFTVPIADAGTPPPPPPPADTTPPSVPSGVSATADNSQQVTVRWAASTDDVAVASYQVKRGGTVVADATGGTTFVDTTVAPDSTYTYTVNAVDTSGNRSADSAASPAVTTPPVAAPGGEVTTDAIAGGTTGSKNAHTVTWSHTTAATANLLLVAVEFNDGGRSVSGVSYAGHALHRVSGTVARSGTRSSDRHVEVWSLLKPPTGVGQVKATVSGSVVPITGESVTFAGVDTTAPLGAPAVKGGTGQNPSVTVASSMSGMVFTGVATAGGTPMPPMGAIASLTRVAGTNTFGGTAVLPGATTVSAGWTAAAGPNAVVGVPVKPAP